LISDRSGTLLADAIVDRQFTLGVLLSLLSKFTLFPQADGIMTPHLASLGDEPAG
jgi:hypothetical protein